MSWSVEVDKQLQEMQIKEPASKPMCGFGRGRSGSNAPAAPGGGQSLNGIGPSTFSFKLSSASTNGQVVTQGQGTGASKSATSGFGGPVGFGAGPGFGTSFGASFGSLSNNTGSSNSGSSGSTFFKSSTTSSSTSSNMDTNADTTSSAVSAAAAQSSGKVVANSSSNHHETVIANVAANNSRRKDDSWKNDMWDSCSDNMDEKPISREEESKLNKLVHDKLVQIKELNINVKNCNRKDLNPTSPLFSLKTFEELRLRQELLQGVSSMGFSYPSKIQEATLPVLLADPPQNIIAQSQSGTGKTAAFVLTMLSRVDSTVPSPQCLCLAPTYELALQIGKIVETMGKFCPDIKVTYAVRGSRVLSRGEKIKEHIIIGTPGTALDWLIKFRCFDPKLIRVFVLDEADIMISQQGHQDQSIRIQKTLNEDCQCLFFSATYDDDVMAFAEKIVSDPIIYTVRKEELPLDNVKQYFVECPNKEDKFKALSNIYGGLTIGQSMIFCHTKKIANWLSSEMTKDGHSVALLSSELDINQRAAVINRFKNAQERCLICTNVCARGIDVEQVTVVINFDLPITANRSPDFETYLHRIGRTGRFGKNGLAINFIDGPQSRAILNEIEKYFDMKIEKLDTTDMEALERIEKES